MLGKTLQMLSLVAATTVGLWSGSAASAADMTTSGPYAILHRIAIGGNAVIAALAADHAGNRIYAAAGRDIRVFDAHTGRILATTSLAGDVTALTTGAEQSGMLYATTGSPSRLVVLRASSLHAVATMPLSGGVPSTLLYDQAEKSLYVESAAGHTIARIDPAARAVLGTARLSGTPMQMVIDARGALYVANAASNAIDVIDAATMRKRGTIPLEGCQAPGGLAIDPVGRRLFVACANGEALIVDTDMGFIFVRLPIAKGSETRSAFAFHPFGPAGWKGGVFFTGKSGMLDAVRMNAFVRYAGVPHMALGGTGTALTLDPVTGQIWLAMAPHDSQGAQILVLGAKP